MADAQEVYVGCAVITSDDGEGSCCPPEFRCICDPDDLFEPPDPTPRVVDGCPAHRARRAYQRYVDEERAAARRKARE